MKKMTIRKAFADAWRVVAGDFGGALMATFLELVLRLIVTLPLLFLADAKLRLLALLSVPLFIFITLPARQNAAEAMQHSLRGMPLFSKRLAFGGAPYGRKLLRGLKTGACLLVWSLPLIAVGIWVGRLYFAGNTAGLNDGFTLMMNLTQFGGGELERGVIYVALIAAGLVLIVLFGCAFHAGRRHEWALGAQRVVPGRRGGLILCHIAAEATLLPAIAAGVWGIMGYLRQYLHGLKSLTGGFALPPMSAHVMIGLIAAVVLLIPAIPLRSLITAAYVHGLWEGKD